MDIVEDEVLEKSKLFLESIRNPKWGLTANEKSIDGLFDSALKLEQILLEEDPVRLKETLFNNFPHFNFSKPADVLLENIIKNQFIDERLSLYAIEKYNCVFSKDNFSKVLDKIISEVKLRRHLFALIEESPDVDLDFLKLNNFLCETLSSSDTKSKIQNALKSQTLVLLNAIKHGDIFSGPSLMDEMIACLECQADLRLWFTILKPQNMDVVLDLCDMYSNFLNALFTFFDKFADEIESTYDEELNVQYSHVNLDFEDFINVFQLLLKRESVGKKVSEYLESKTVTDKNFCFWIDVKSCL